MKLIKLSNIVPVFGLSLLAIVVFIHNYTIQWPDPDTRALIVSINELRRNLSSIVDVIERLEHKKQDVVIAVERRNNISRQLNALTERYKVNVCRIQDTTDTGAFCQVQGSGHMFDDGVAMRMNILFHNQTVLSLGDGPGDYKQFLVNGKSVVSVDAYDGTPNIVHQSNAAVQFIDLAVPQYGMPIYDWVMSLEVGEHIPRRFESIFVNNLVRHARVGILLSWAQPGQDGFHHVNNRKSKFVDSLMKDHCFYLDNQKTQTMRQSAKFIWLMKNLKVFLRDRIKCEVDENKA